MFFPERERTVLRYWVGSWAAVCVASCLFTVSNISVFRSSDLAIFLYQFCHFPFAILMRHNVRHSIFNLMAINHARQKCSSLCCSSSFPLRWAYPTFFLAFLLSAAIFSFGSRQARERGEGLGDWASSFRISLAVERSPTVSLLCCCHFGKSHALTYYLSAHIFQ